MNRIKKVIGIVLTAVLLCATGCGKKEEAADQNNLQVVFKYGDSTVTKGETYIYVRTIKERYERQYGEDVWQLSLPEDSEDEVSIVELTKQAVIDEIVRVKTLVAHAAELHVRLTEDEETELKTRAREFYEGLTDTDIAAMELTEDIVMTVMSDCMLAKKVEEKVLADDPVEISSEEARMTTFYDMYFPCYETDAGGNITPYSAEKKAEQYENALHACGTLATANIDDDEKAGDIEKLAEYYGLKEGGEQTLTPQEISRIYGEKACNLLYSMKDGEYSAVVETEYGYHIFQMIALTDEKATEGRKEAMTNDAVAEKMSSIMTGWRNEIDKDFVYPDSVDMEVYDSITLD